MPKTSAPPIGIFEELYANLLTVHEAVVSVHLSAKFSGTYGVACAAAKAVDGERVRVVDSRFTSVALGWMAQRAAELAERGESCEAVVAELEQMAPRLRIYLTLETLEYLQRGGRIGRAQAFLGNVLNVKPVLEIRGGEIFPVERVRTRAAAVRRLVELAESAGPSEALAVVHGDCDGEAISLRQDLVLRGRVGEIPVAELGAVVAAYTGPGVLGVGCLLAPSGT
jgi:DegV family protein with EDD domain